MRKVIAYKTYFQEFMQTLREDQRRKMQNNDFMDINAYLDEKYGAIGTPERESFDNEARQYMLGIILRDERKKCHMTQAQLARKVNTKPSIISRIEKGLIDPGFSLVMRILDALGRRFEIVESIPI